MAREQFNPNRLQLLLEDVGAILHKHAPGFEWEVAGSTEGSMIYFYCPDLSSTKGYVQALHTKEVQQTTGRNRLIMRAQGEYLDQYGLRPNVLNQEFSGLFDARGEPIPMGI